MASWQDQLPLHSITERASLFAASGERPSLHPLFRYLQCDQIWRIFASVAIFWTNLERFGYILYAIG